jgi:hypothetical protein
MAGEHILIVDDEPAIRSTLRDVLEDEGYRVSAVGGGADALQAQPYLHCQAGGRRADLALDSGPRTHCAGARDEAANRVGVIKRSAEEKRLWR